MASYAALWLSVNSQLLRAVTIARITPDNAVEVETARKHTLNRHPAMSHKAGSCWTEGSACNAAGPKGLTRDWPKPATGMMFAPF
jgi:hypothetical protein